MTPSQTRGRYREVVEWENQRLQIVSREDLAAMKRLAGRPQGLPDLQNSGFSDEPEEDPN